MILHILKPIFFILVKSIKNFESSNLSLFDTTKIVDETILNMEMVHKDNGTIIKEEVSDLLHKNDGFKMLKQISDVLFEREGSVLPQNFTPMMSYCMKFVPVIQLLTSKDPSILTK